MTELLHIEDCPGCQDALLTPEDWRRLPDYQRRPHLFVPPPQLAPPTPHDHNVTGLRIVCGVIGVGLLAVVSWPAAVAVTVAGFGLWGLAYRNHRLNHKPRKRGCGWCVVELRAEATQQWNHYGWLIQRQRQRWHAQQYQTLQEGERRYQPPG